MSGPAAFALGVAGPVAATLAANLLLRGPLVQFLAELCRGRERGQLWESLFSRCAVLAAAIGSSLPDGALRSPRLEGRALLGQALLQAALGVASLAASTGLLALLLLAWLRVLDRGARSAAHETQLWS